MKKMNVFMCILCVFSLIISCISINSVQIVKGEKGDRGEKGVDGYTPYVGAKGTWIVNGKNTNVPATTVYDTTMNWYKLKCNDTVKFVFYAISRDTKVSNRISGFYHTQEGKTVCVKVRFNDADYAKYFPYSDCTVQTTILIEGEVIALYTDNSTGYSIIEISAKKVV